VVLFVWLQRIVEIKEIVQLVLGNVAFRFAMGSVSMTQIALVDSQDVEHVLMVRVFLVFVDLTAPLETIMRVGVKVVHVLFAVQKEDVKLVVSVELIV